MNDLQVSAESGMQRVTINRPAKRNALSRRLLKDLGEVFAAGSSDQHPTAAVLRGSGELCFAAGGDLHELSAIDTAEGAEAMASQVKASLGTVCCQRGERSIGQSAGESSAVCIGVSDEPSGS